MTIDMLTIAGFFSAASFLLMPILMKREFIRVESDEQAPTPSARLQQRPQAETAARLRPGSIKTA